MVYLFWFMRTRSEAPIKHLAFGFQSLCEDDPRAVDTQVLGKYLTARAKGLRCRVD